MQTTWSDNNWFETNNSIKRQVIAFLLSSIVVIIILFIPVKLQKILIEKPTTIKVELNITQPQQLKTPDIIKPNNVPVKTMPKTVVKPNVVEPVVNSTKTVVPVVNQYSAKPIETVTKIVTIQPKEIESPTTSGDILNSKVSLDSFKVDKDFQAVTGREDDFKFKTIEQPEWNQVTKLIDEEVDKPQYEMNFYSPGIEGVTERFFDKISYKKRFTTKYGTKIDCVLIAGVIGACGWK